MDFFQEISSLAYETSPRRVNQHFVTLKISSGRHRADRNWTVGFGARQNPTDFSDSLFYFYSGRIKPSELLAWRGGRFPAAPEVFYLNADLPKNANQERKLLDLEWVILLAVIKALGKGLRAGFDCSEVHYHRKQTRFCEIWTLSRCLVIMLSKQPHRFLRTCVAELQQRIPLFGVTKSVIRNHEVSQHCPNDG